MKKLLSMVLAVCLVFSLLGAGGVFADGVAGDTLQLDPQDRRMKDAAKKLVGEFIDKYQTYEFGKAVTIGDKATYFKRIDECNLVFNPELKPNALFETGNPPTITIKEDIASGVSKDATPGTLFHELTHAIEYENKDFENENYANRDYQERNIEYMEQVFSALDKLRLVEIGLAKGETNEEAKKRYEEFLKVFNGAAQQPSTKAFPVDLTALKGWMGFYVEPKRILEHYASGDAGDRLKEFANYYNPTTIKPPAPTATQPPVGSYWKLTDVSLRPNKDETTSTGSDFKHTVSDGKATFRQSHIRGDVWQVSATWTRPKEFYYPDETVELTLTVKVDEYNYNAQEYTFMHGNCAARFYIADVRTGAGTGNSAYLVDEEGKDFIHCSGSHGKIDVASSTKTVTGKPLAVYSENERLEIHIVSRAGTAAYIYQLVNQTIVLRIGSVYMKARGKNVTLDTAPVLLGGRTVLPIRAVAEAMGGTVDWDGVDSKVTITKGDTKIEMWVDNNTISVNGVSKTIDVAPTVINGRTMVPVRFVTDNIPGCETKWNPDDSTVTINW